MRDATYTVSNAIRYRRIEGCGVILDLRSQRYSVLDDVATEMWELLTRPGDRAEWLCAWAQSYEAPPSEMNQALEAFSQDCRTAGWFTQSAPVGQDIALQRASRFPSGARRLPASAIATIALAWTAISLKTRGFGSTYGLAKDIAMQVHADSRPSLEQAVRDFLAAENLFYFKRGPNDCLVRSLALFRYLRWRGIAARHIIGVRRVPFAAHAWVEVDGSGVLAPTPRGFIPLATLTSSR